MDTTVHFSSKTDDWATPQAFFDDVNAEFDLLWDVCASESNHKLPLYYTPETDGLKADWTDKRVWMNPPYGAEIKHWVKKAAIGGAEIAVCLLPARTDTRYFHEFIYKNREPKFDLLKGA